MPVRPTVTAAAPFEFRFASEAMSSGVPVPFPSVSRPKLPPLVRFTVPEKSAFRFSVPKPVLTWSARKTYRILGHHDATHKTIVISKSLDSTGVPKYVVESVVFHEMLHIHHPTVHNNGRRYNHTAAFRRDEEKFAYFQEAERWIERNVRKLRKEAKRR